MNKIITKNGLILASFALVITTIVGITQHLTKDKIDEQERKQLLKTLDQVIPRASYNNKLFLNLLLFTGYQRDLIYIISLKTLRTALN